MAALGEGAFGAVLVGAGPTHPGRRQPGEHRRRDKAVQARAENEVMHHKPGEARTATAGKLAKV